MDASRRFPGDLADFRGGRPERNLATRAGIPSLLWLPSTRDAALRPDCRARASLPAVLGAQLRKPSPVLPRAMGMPVASHDRRPTEGTTARGAGALCGATGVC